MEKGKNLNIWLASQIRMDFIPIGKGTRMRAACLISFAVFVTLAGPVDYVCGYLSPSGVEIVPQNPTSCDIVDITLSGGWPDSCMPYDSTVSMVGNDIYIDVIWPDQSCPPMPTSWEWTESVGPLSVGTYTIYARLIGYPQTPEEYTQMTEFIVTDKQFVFNTESVTVPEGCTATFTVSLFGDPCELVEVSVVKESGDDDITVVSGGTLVFDSSNYSLPQTVTLTAAEDEDYINGTAIIRISAPGYITAEVNAVEWDDDMPRVVYVDRRAPGLCDGRSWMDAFTHLHDALSAASQAPEVEEICVAQGTYRPDQGITVAPGDREATFQLLDGLAIKGGYAGFGEPDPNARDIDLYESILSGDLNGNDVAVADPRDLRHEPTRSENSFHVVTGSWTDDTAVLDGFTIIGGNASEIENASGGGMLIMSGSPKVVDCTFTTNSAFHGGGMASYWSSPGPTLVNCTFTRNFGSPGGGGMYGRATLISCMFNDNVAGYGGGIRCTTQGSLKATGCTFSGNLATWYGGGVQLWNCGRVVFADCEFTKNTGGEGGGLYSFKTDCTLTNCTFTQNSAIGGDRKEGCGGGVYRRKHIVKDDTVLVIANCTFVGNSARKDGGGLYGLLWPGVRLTNSIFWGNVDGGGLDESAQVHGQGRCIDYCCIQGWTGNLGGTGNIGDEPLFVDSTGGNYHLSELSPCINAGDPSYIAEPNETDLDGNPRITGERIDMGAYEYEDYEAQFIDSGISLIGVLYSVVAWGDYDNDGDLDLAVCGQRNSKIYKNNGYGIFTDIAAVLPETAITGAFAWGDYDNDGDLDFAINGADFTRIYKNEGNDTFIDIGIELPSLCYFLYGHQLGSGSIVWGDYDNDGDLDIVLSGARGFVKIYRNNGDETFTDVGATGFTGVTYSSIAWGDYDNDGNLDLAICGSIGGGVWAPTITSIYRNNGDSTFTDINAGLPGTSRVSLAWGDYDNDGDLDLAVNRLGIYKNNGDDTFTNIGVGVRGGDHASLVWGDYDNDGDLDIAACGSYKTIVYKNNGDDTFTDINAGLTGVSMGDLAWGDYDNDGDLDLAVSGYIMGPTITKIYKNLEADSVGNSNPNSFASPPTLLPQEPHSNILKWDSGYDEETPTDGLYYHIRVGTVSGKDDIVSGVYGSPLLGNYLRPKVSNEQLGIRLNNLPPSGVTYYWSVKTIDTGLQASEWSDEGTFVSNNIPIADAGGDQTAYAWIDGIAEVTMDGTGSFDDDGQLLTYLWSWTINGQTYDVNGVTATIELPVGEQTIELIVNDGIDDSQPDHVVVTVIESLESLLRIIPRVINRHSRQPKILALLRLPEGVTANQIDSNERLLLYPGGIEAMSQRVIESRRQGVSIFALFDKAELMDAVSDNGSVELQVVGNLKTGQYFYGTDTVRIISPRNDNNGNGRPRTRGNRR